MRIRTLESLFVQTSSSQPFQPLVTSSHHVHFHLFDHNLLLSSTTTAHTSIYGTDPQSRKITSQNMTTKITLYDRLGGADAVRAAVDEFYQRNLATPELAPLFGETNMTALRAHQIQFLTLAFTGTVGDLDVPAYIYEKHKKLFLEKGLNAHHFDLVAGNLVGTLQHLGVSPALIDEAVAIVAPLRSVFETGVEQAQKEAVAGNDEQSSQPSALVDELDGVNVVS